MSPIPAAPSFATLVTQHHAYRKSHPRKGPHWHPTETAILLLWIESQTTFNWHRTNPPFSTICEQFRCQVFPDDPFFFGNAVYEKICYMRSCYNATRRRVIAASDGAEERNVVVVEALCREFRRLEDLWANRPLGVRTRRKSEFSPLKAGEKDVVWEEYYEEPVEEEESEEGEGDELKEESKIGGTAVPVHQYSIVKKEEDVGNILHIKVESREAELQDYYTGKDIFGGFKA